MSKEKITSFLKKIENNRFLVQGTGGNVSWKDNSTMWIKASGKSLKNSTNEEIFVPIDLNGNEINKKDIFKLRPSIETSMHRVLPYKYVIHLHSVEHIAYSSSDYYDINTIKNQIFFRVPYSKPGQLLSNNINEIIESKVIPKDTIFFILK